MLNILRRVVACNSFNNLKWVLQQSWLASSWHSFCCRVHTGYTPSYHPFVNCVLLFFMLLLLVSCILGGKISVFVLFSYIILSLSFFYTSFLSSTRPDLAWLSSVVFELHSMTPSKMSYLIFHMVVVSVASIVGSAIVRQS